MVGVQASAEVLLLAVAIQTCKSYRRHVLLTQMNESQGRGLASVLALLLPMNIQPETCQYITSSHHYAVHRFAKNSWHVSMLTSKVNQTIQGATHTTVCSVCNGRSNASAQQCKCSAMQGLSNARAQPCRCSPLRCSIKDARCSWKAAPVLLSQLRGPCHESSACSWLLLLYSLCSTWLDWTLRSGC